MDSLNLQRCCNELLDLGKRNKLLYFHPGSDALPLYSRRNGNEVLEWAKMGKSFSFYDADPLQKEMGVSVEAYNASESERLRVLERALAQEEKEKGLDSLLFPLPKKHGIQQALRRLKNASNLSLEEKGINVLYLSFGFLRWNDPNDGEVAHSPLLLVPVTLSFLPEKNRFELSLYSGDDIHPNSTLSYRLKTAFQISLPSFDVENQSLDAYLSAVGQATKGIPGSQVENGMALGLFGFSKIDMYRDLKDHEPLVLSNPLVQALFGQASHLETPSNSGSSSEKVELHNVVDADASQIEAILQAKKGMSFVLQGPPGTGKSQTIANIIAEALYDGKRVLFVSEKKAALDVVLHKLEQANLSDFCLSLHGKSANKKEAIDEIHRVLNLPAVCLKPEADKKLEQLSQEKESLDTYCSVLSKVEPHLGLTLSSLLGKACQELPFPLPDFFLPRLEEKGEEQRREAVETLGEIADVASFFGRDPSTYPFYGFLLHSAGYEERAAFRHDLNAAQSGFWSLEQRRDFLFPCGLVETSASFSELEAAWSKAIEAAQRPYFDPALYNNEKRSDIQIRLFNAEEAAKKEKVATEDLLRISKPEALEFCDEDLRERYLSSCRSLFRGFSRQYRQDKAALASLSKEKHFHRKQALELLKRLEARKDAVSAAENTLKALNVEFTNPDFIAKDSLAKFSTQWKRMASDSTRFRQFLSGLDTILFLCWKGQLFGLDEQKEGREAFEAVIQRFDPKKKNLAGLPLEEAKQQLGAYLDHFEELETNLRYLQAEDQAVQGEYESFFQEYLASSRPLSSMGDCFSLCFYRQWAHRVLESDPALASSRAQRDRLVASFQRDDRLGFSIAQSQIRAKRTAGLSSVPGPSGGIVARFEAEAAKKRRVMPLRTMLREFGPLVQQVKPCFMMSPLSVSSYLESGVKFDLVLFDEASQIFPWDALGAIYRSKQAIIVGDAMQMPPTSFFLAGAEDEIDGEEDGVDVGAFESILDFASAFPRIRLQWHYRSRSEDLIAFSNQYFYEGGLVTFPSPIKKQAGQGVDFHYVPQAVYNRKQHVNQDEAKAVVDLIFQDMALYPKQSLGVVCMNLAQQELIQSLFEAKQRGNSSWHEFEKAHEDEPLFIKNLETVQGDERDRIILDIGYGRDGVGRFYHNFGPLNREGGERRLNVAITRAKDNVQVVSSIHSTDIEEERLTSVGPKLLKRYLSFAETGMGLASLEMKKSETVDSSLAESVRNFLLEKGYHLDANVGCSSYRVDLGVRHPNHDQYVIALETDGSSYLSSSSCRERNRLREQVLEGKGWKFHRIWSVDWFLHRKKEEDLLLQTIDAAIRASDEPLGSKPPEPSSNILSYERILPKGPDALESHFPLYPSVKLSSFATPQALVEMQTHASSYAKILRTIVGKEQPVCEDTLVRRLATVSGRQKPSRTVEVFLQELLDRPNIGIQGKRGDVQSYYFLTPDCLKTPLRIGGDRKLLSIPDEEVENGLIELLRLSLCSTEEGLIRDFCHLVGSKRSQEGDTFLQKRIQELLSRGLFEQNEAGELQIKR